MTAANTDMLDYTVRVKARVLPEDLDEDDIGVEGSYSIWLPAQASGWSQSQQAKRVLDEFHEDVAIHTLDDFEITVENPQGEEIFEDFED